MKKFSLKVKINSERPDYRVFGAFFFGEDLHNYDGDGNSYPVWSRNWTELYMCSRENGQSFDISPDNEEETILKITAERQEDVNALAYFLAKETNGEILDADNQIIDAETLKSQLGDFDLENRLRLAKESIWRQTSAENPYPNLKKEK